MTKSDVVDISVILHAETKMAVLVSDSGDKKDAVWLPRSQIELEKKGAGTGICVVTLPEWLANEKGLI